MTCIRGLPQDEINPCLEIYISSYWLQKEKSCLRFSALSLYIWSQLTQRFYLFQRKWVSCYLLPSLVRKLDWLSKYNAENFFFFFFNVVFMNWGPTWHFHNSLFWSCIRFKNLFFFQKQAVRAWHSEFRNIASKEIQKFRNRPVWLQPCCKMTFSAPHFLEAFNGFLALIILYLFIYNLLKVTGRNQEQCQNKAYVDFNIFQWNLFLCW